MSSSMRRASLAGLLSAVAALALTGCGSDAATPTSGSTSTTTTTPSPTTPSAGDLYSRARKSALAAKSGHLIGSFTEKGKTMNMDLAGTADGTNQSMKIKAAEGEITIITASGKTYLMASQKFWKSQAGAPAAKMFKGKYVLLPATQAKEMGDQTIQKVLKDMFAEGDLSFLERANARVEKATVDGVDAWKLTEKVGGDGTAIFVSSDGKARLLKIDGGKSEPGAMTFSEWDAVPKITAPKASQVVKLPN